MIQYWAQNNSRRGASFNPASIPNLALWFDAADTSTITLDGSNNVEQWRDKSGNARHGSQAASLSRPSYASNTVTATTGKILSLASRLTVAGDFTVFAVASNAGTLFVLLDSSSSFSTSTANSKVLWFNNWPGTGFTTSLSALANPNLNTDAFAGVNMLRLQREGTAGTFAENAVSVSRTFNTNNLDINDVVGHRQTNVSGDTGMREILVFTRSLAAGEVNSVSAYLKAKWGTP